MSRPNWSEREDEIVRTLYPSVGARGCVEAMRSEHFARTEGATKERAKKLKVKRDMGKMTRRSENAWSEEEVEVIKAVFPKGGATAVKSMLDQLGYSRTAGAIATRANILGIKSERRRDGGEKKVCNFVVDKELDREIIDKLASQRNRSDYIRRLITDDIRRSGTN